MSLLFRTMEISSAPSGTPPHAPTCRAKPNFSSSVTEQIPTAALAQRCHKMKLHQVRFLLNHLRNDFRAAHRIIHTKHASSPNCAGRLRGQSLFAPKYCFASCDATRLFASSPDIAIKQSASRTPAFFSMSMFVPSPQMISTSSAFASCKLRARSLSMIRTSWRRPPKCGAQGFRPPCRRP